MIQKKSLHGGLKSGKAARSTNLNDYNLDTAPTTPDVQIVLLKAPIIQYEQLALNTNFRQCLEMILFSARVLQMGVQKTPYQKTYELLVGSQDFTVGFQCANRQFDWIEISLVYVESDKHLTIYDSYNAECASKLIKSLEFANISKQYSSTNTLKFDIENDLQKHLLYKQFVAWNADGCSTAPLSDFMINPIAQELKNQTDYFGNGSDKKLYVDLQQSRGYTDELEKPSRNNSSIIISIQTKAALTKKMRLRVWGYTNGEYIYLLHNGSLTLKYKMYTIRWQYEELES